MYFFAYSAYTLFYCVIFSIYKSYYKTVCRVSSVVTATRYGLDGPGVESRWGRGFPHPSRPALRPTQLPIQWVASLFPRVKAAGARFRKFSLSTLIFNAKHCRSQTPGTTLFSTTSDRDGSPRLPTKRSSRAVTRRGPANHLWFVHDAAPPHFLPAVRQFSNNLFPQQRTVRCGPTARPAHQRGNIHSLPFMLQHSASPGLVTAEPISAGAAVI